MTEAPKKKTWARELATVMWLGCAVLAYNDQVEMANVFIWPVTIFSLAAFGFRQPVIAEWMRSR